MKNTGEFNNNDLFNILFAAGVSASQARQAIFGRTDYKEYTITSSIVRRRIRHSYVSTQEPRPSYDEMPHTHPSTNLEHKENLEYLTKASYHGLLPVCDFDHEHESKFTTAQIREHNDYIRAFVTKTPDHSDGRTVEGSTITKAQNDLKHLTGLPYNGLFPSDDIPSGNAHLTREQRGAHNSYIRTFLEKKAAHPSTALSHVEQVTEGGARASAGAPNRGY